MFVHLFRMPDGKNHAVITARKKVPRNGQFRAACQLIVDDTAKRIAARNQGDHEKAAVISCDSCLEATTF